VSLPAINEGTASFSSFSDDLGSLLQPANEIIERNSKKFFMDA
jgi:hypothetical protein